MAIEQAKCNKREVFDIMDSLAKFFEEYINKKDIQVIDLLMGVHNFHKLTLQNIVDLSCETQEQKLAMYESAKLTFSYAIDALIGKSEGAGDFKNINP